MEEYCAPHFFFSWKRKRNVPRPVQRKRALGAAFVTKAAPFSFVLYVLMVVPWCYADWFYRLRRCRWRGGKIAFLPEKSGFHSESRLMYLFNFCCCRALVLFCLCFDLFQQFSIDTHCETRLILSGKWKNIAPHISFSLEREKETCRARYKEKENSERLSWRKVLLFRLCFMSWPWVSWYYADWLYRLHRWRWQVQKMWMCFNYLAYWKQGDISSYQKNHLLLYYLCQ